MNRLVEQLLCVARLDSVVLDCSPPVDLRQLAEEVVGAMAHLALAAGRTIALIGVDHPVIVIKWPEPPPNDRAEAGAAHRSGGRRRRVPRPPPRSRFRLQSET